MVFAGPALVAGRALLRGARGVAGWARAYPVGARPEGDASAPAAGAATAGAAEREWLLRGKWDAFYDGS